MSNPFETKFDSECQDCGAEVLQGDDMYVVDGNFLCISCAEINGNVCDCGNYKKDDYDTCYECFETTSPF